MLYQGSEKFFDASSKIWQKNAYKLLFEFEKGLDTINFVESKDLETEKGKIHRQKIEKINEIKVLLAEAMQNQRNKDLFIKNFTDIANLTDQLAQNTDFDDFKINNFFIQSRYAFNYLMGSEYNKYQELADIFLTSDAEPDLIIRKGIRHGAKKTGEYLQSSFKENILNYYRKEIKALESLPNQIQCEKITDITANNLPKLKEIIAPKRQAEVNLSVNIDSKEKLKTFVQQKIYGQSFDYYYTHVGTLSDALSKVERLAASQSNSAYEIAQKKEELLAQIGLTELNSIETKDYLNSLASCLGFDDAAALHKNYQKLNTRSGFNQYKESREQFIENCVNKLGNDLKNTSKDLLNNICKKEYERLNKIAPLEKSATYFTIVRAAGVTTRNNIIWAQQKLAVELWTNDNYLQQLVTQYQSLLDWISYFFKSKVDSIISTHFTSAIESEDMLSERYLENAFEPIEKKWKEVIDAQRTKDNENFTLAIEAIKKSKDPITYLLNKMDADEKAKNEKEEDKSAFKNSVYHDIHKEYKIVKNAFYQIEQEKIDVASLDGLNAYIKNVDRNNSEKETEIKREIETHQETIIKLQETNNATEKWYDKLIFFLTSYKTPNLISNEKRSLEIKKLQELINVLEKEIKSINIINNELILRATKQKDIITTLSALPTCQILEKIKKDSAALDEYYWQLRGDFYSSDPDIVEQLEKKQSAYKIQFYQLLTVMNVSTQNLNASVEELSEKLTQLEIVFERKLLSQEKKFTNLTEKDKLKFYGQYLNLKEAIKKEIEHKKQEQQNELFQKNKTIILEKINDKIEAANQNGDNFLEEFHNPSLDNYQEQLKFLSEKNQTTIYEEVFKYYNEIFDENIDGLSRHQLENLYFDFKMGQHIFLNRKPQSEKDKIALEFNNIIVEKIENQIKNICQQYKNLPDKELTTILSDFDTDFSVYLQKSIAATKNLVEIENEYHSIKNSILQNISKENVDLAIHIDTAQREQLELFCTYYLPILDQYEKKSQDLFYNMSIVNLTSHTEKLKERTKNITDLVSQYKPSLKAVSDKYDNILALAQSFDAKPLSKKLQEIEDDSVFLKEDLTKIKKIITTIRYRIIENQSLDMNLVKECKDLSVHLNSEIIILKKEINDIKERYKPDWLDRNKLKSKLNDNEEKINRTSEDLALQLDVGFLEQIVHHDETFLPTDHISLSLGLILALSHNRDDIAQDILSVEPRQIDTKFLADSLNIAAREGNLSIIKQLFHYRNDTFFTQRDLISCLSEAIESNHMDVAYFILSNSKIHLDDKTIELMQNLRPKDISNLTKIQSGYWDYDAPKLNKLRNSYLWEEALLLFLKNSPNLTDLADKIENVRYVKEQLFKNANNLSYDNLQRKENYSLTWEDEVEIIRNEFFMFPQNPHATLKRQNFILQKENLLSNIKDPASVRNFLDQLSYFKLNNEEHHKALLEAFIIAAQNNAYEALPIILASIENSRLKNEFIITALRETFHQGNFAASKNLLQTQSYLLEPQFTNEIVDELKDILIEKEKGNFDKKHMVLSKHIMHALSSSILEYNENVEALLSFYCSDNANPESVITPIVAPSFWQRMGVTSDIDGPTLQKVKELFTFYEDVNAALSDDLFYFWNELNTVDEKLFPDELKKLQQAFEVEKEYLNRRLERLDELLEKGVIFYRPLIKDSPRFESQLTKWRGDLKDAIGKRQKNCDQYITEIQEKLREPRSKAIASAYDVAIIKKTSSSHSIEPSNDLKPPEPKPPR